MFLIPIVVLGLLVLAVLLLYTFAPFGAFLLRRGIDNAKRRIRQIEDILGEERN